MSKPETPLPKVQWQWQRNNIDIPGANSYSYTPTFADVGQKLTRVADYLKERSDSYAESN